MRTGRHFGDRADGDSRATLRRERQYAAVGCEEPAPALPNGHPGGGGSLLPGPVVSGAMPGEGVHPVEKGGHERHAVLQKDGAGAVGPGPQSGKGTPGVIRRHQRGQVRRFGELDGLDLARRAPDRRDPILVPHSAVEHMQQLAAEIHDGGHGAAGGGDPVDGQRAGDARPDAELFLQLAGSPLCGGLALDGATGQQAGGPVADTLEQNLPAPVGDQHGRTDPHSGRGTQRPVRLVSHRHAGTFVGCGSRHHLAPIAGACWLGGEAGARRRGIRWSAGPGRPSWGRG
ncbi:hypothetical protein SUDANB178_00061 [Streptomyces sp. enrichment culture]